jgi:putative ubiquitin-RnfH superfamily antitoxin RatB of RatAB toxin-antitoxin module
MIPIEWIKLAATDSGILTRLPNTMHVPAGCTVYQALEHMGWPQERIEAALFAHSVAVFGLYAKADTILHPHDRLELLDVLHLDPKERRRKRAK